MRIYRPKYDFKHRVLPQSKYPWVRADVKLFPAQGTPPQLRYPWVHELSVTSLYRTQFYSCRILTVPPASLQPSYPWSRPQMLFFLPYQNPRATVRGSQWRKDQLLRRDSVWVKSFPDAFHKDWWFFPHLYLYSPRTKFDRSNVFSLFTPGGTTISIC